MAKYSAEDWNRRGMELMEEGELKLALKCFNEAIKLNPEYTWAIYNIGEVLRKQEKFEDAIFYYNKVLEINQKDDWAWYQKGSCFLKLEKFQDALDCFDKAIAINPQHKEAIADKEHTVSFLKGAPEEFNRRGMELAKKGKSAEASSFFRKASRLDPKFTWPLYNIGELYREEGNCEKAIGFYDKVLEINQKDDWAWYQKGSCFLKLEKYDSAIECFNQALKINPKFSEAIAGKETALTAQKGAAEEWYHNGVELMKKGKFEEATQCFDEALKINPEFEAALYEKGEALLAQIEFAAAIECFEKALKINPKSAEATFGKARVLTISKGLLNEETKGSIISATKLFEEQDNVEGINRVKVWINNPEWDFKAADRKLTERLKENPDDEVTWYQKGLSLLNQKKFGDAIDCFDKALKIDPKFADAWYNKGVALLTKKGGAAEAQKCLKVALELYRGRKNLYGIVQVGMVIRQLKGMQQMLGSTDKNAALKFLDKTLAENPEDEAAWIQKGIILLGIMNFHEARRCFSKALEINKESEPAWTGRGDSYLGEKRWHEAIVNYGKSLEIDPKNGAAWYNKGLAHFELDQYKEAVDCFDNALGINSESAEAMFGKGRALSFIAKKKAEAKRCLEKARELFKRQKNPAAEKEVIDWLKRLESGKLEAFEEKE